MLNYKKLKAVNTTEYLSGKFVFNKLVLYNGI